MRRKVTGEWGRNKVEKRVSGLFTLGWGGGG